MSLDQGYIASGAQRRAGALPDKYSFDGWLVISAAILMLIGLLSLYSIDRGSGQSGYFVRQVFRIAIGIVPFLIMFLVPLRTISRASTWMYGFMIASLVAIMFIGREGGGATRWVQFGPLEFQPSESAKIILTVCLATFFAARREDIQKFRTFFLSLLMSFVPMALIMKQPHLGATLTLFTIWFAISMLAGVRMKYLFGTVAALLGVLIFSLKMPGILSPYHKERVETFLKGGSSQDEYYQQIRALIAYSSGGATGQGLFKGEFKGTKFVPAQQTDYISTVIGEEGGLAGCACMLAAFGFFFYRVWLIMFSADDLFSKLVVGGVFAYLAAHTIANLGMCLTLFPVVGLWLPFMSQGGTSMWLCMASVGLLLNIRRTQKPALF